MSVARPSRRRWIAGLLVVGLAIAVVALVPAFRRPVLRTMGHVLVVEEPLQPADVIVVSLGAGEAGLLEAADLVHSGIASKVGVFTEVPSPVDRELLRRGITRQDRPSWPLRLLGELGVSNVEELPLSTGTTDEGPLLSEWCERQGLRSIVVVTSPDHSRRTARVLRRSLKRTPVTVTVRVTPYSSFDPDRWWQTRSGVRTEIVELEKLLLDVAMHPFS